MMIANEVGEKLKGLKPRWDTVPGWKRKLLYAATGLGLFGLGADGYEAVTAEAPPAGARQAVPATSVGIPLSAKEPTRAQAAAGAPDGGAFEWGGPTGRLGLSFSIAFLAALAIRWFIKTALTVAGIAAAGAALLVHYEVVDASQIGDTTEWAKSLGPWLAEQTETATAFLKGHLPSGAASGAGLFLGLRK